MRKFEVGCEYVVSFGFKSNASILTFKCIDRDLESVNLMLVSVSGDFDFAKRTNAFEALQSAAKVFDGKNYLRFQCDSLGEYEFVKLFSCVKADVLAHICA